MLAVFRKSNTTCKCASVKMILMENVKKDKDQATVSHERKTKVFLCDNDAPDIF